MRPALRALALCVLVSACGSKVKDGSVVLEPVATFAGRVQDRATAKGLAGVSVATSPPGGYATTNSQGEYVLAGGLSVGRAYRLQFDKAGYAPAVLDGVGAPAAGQTRIADVAMDRTRAALGLRGKDLVLGVTANEAAFAISNVGEPGEVLSYSLSTTAPWLKVTPQTGNVVDVAAIVTVSADRLVLGSNWGVYTATIEVVSNAGAGTVAVRLTHQPEALGYLTSDTTLLDYGGVDKARTLRLDNPGGQPVNWELVAVPGFLTPAARGGTVGAGNFALLELLLDRGALTPGTYVGEVRINTDSEVRPQLVVAARFVVPPRVSVALTSSFIDLGEDLAAKAFGVINDGNVAFEYDVTWPAPWEGGDPRICSQRPRLSTIPKSGVLPPGATASVGVRIDRAGLVPGEAARPVVVNIRKDGRLVEQRTVTVRYATKARAALDVSIDRLALDPLHGGANVVLRVTSKGLDPCDLLTNVPLAWTLDSSVPWLTTSKAGGLLDLPAVAGGIFDASAAPVGFIHAAVDWRTLPRVAGDSPATLTLRWCTPLPGLPFSCATKSEVQTIALTVTLPGAQVEKAASWTEPDTLGFSSRTVAAYNPFGNRVFMGPSFHKVLDSGYWLEWDLTPGAEVGYQMDAGDLPASWSPGTVFVDEGPAGGGSTLAYDWAHDAYVSVWTFLDHGTPRSLTWVYQGGGWTSVTPSTAGITGVHSPSLFYDTRRNRMLLYGGYHDKLTPDDTLRVFDFASLSWSVVTSTVIGAGLDVTHSTMIYDASQDRYLLHGGRPLVSVANQTTSAVERTWAVDPDTLAVTGLTPVAGYPAEAWGRQLVHNVEQNITYAYGGCFDFRFGPSSIGEVCYEPQLRVLLNPGAHPLPLPPYAETPNTGLTTEGQYGVGLFHLTYDPNYDRLLLTGSDAVADPITGVIEYGASAWQLLYQRPLPALPLLSASATALSLGGGGSGSFDLINTAAALGLYRVLPIESWLSVDQPAGYLAAGTSVHVGVTAKTAGLASGVHRGTLRVDGAAKQSFAVTVEVTVP